MAEKAVDAPVLDTTAKWMHTQGRYKWALSPVKRTSKAWNICAMACSGSFVPVQVTINHHWLLTQARIGCRKQSCHVLAGQAESRFASGLQRFAEVKEPPDAMMSCPSKPLAFWLEPSGTSTSISLLLLGKSRGLFPSNGCG